LDFFLTIVHVATCLFLIAVVLLQHGKGADIGAAFGGGASNTVFGSRGAGNFLTKLTTFSVVVFMLTSLTLSWFSGGSSISDELRDGAVIEAPVDLETPESLFPEATPIAPADPSSEGSGEAPSGFETIPAPAAEPEQDE
jgi:preprotein translocase subunit SecG